MPVSLTCRTLDATLLTIIAKHPEPDTMPIKILLADDSITIQKVVELTFSDGDYEVVATSNGTKAIEQIHQLRPDIILSDIIMPEKNGYELCEWVKSHPEYRTIPVILLTGTFEPFDPDRAEKAGCDAVVTKPFESQSLIQKVEELIQAAGAGGEQATAAPAGGGAAFTPEFPEEPDQEEPAQAPAFDLDEPATASPFAGSDSAEEAAASPFPDQEEEPPVHGDVFEAATPGESPDDLDDTATRMIPKMSFDEIQRIQQQNAAAQPLEEEPMSGQIPSDGFEPETDRQPDTAPEGTESPLDAHASFEEEAEPERWEDDATRMMPKMSFEEMQRLQQQVEQASSSEPVWEEPEASAPELAPHEPEPASEESVWGAPAEDAAPFEEPPQFEQPDQLDEPQADPEAPAVDQEPEDDGATRMIPKMSFDEMERLQQQGMEEEAPSESLSLIGGTAPSPSAEEAPVNPFATPDEEAQPSVEAASPFAEDLSPEPGAARDEVPPLVSDEDEARDWAPASPAAEPELTSVSTEPEHAATTAAQRDLDDEQIERIARRVVQMLSDKAIRDIAWEVIPETAEMVVRERIRELEHEEG
jgi:CheY-like chemotaxis protein